MTALARATMGRSRRIQAGSAAEANLSPMGEAPKSNLGNPAKNSSDVISRSFLRVAIM